VDFPLFGQNIGFGTAAMPTGATTPSAPAPADAGPEAPSGDGRLGKAAPSGFLEMALAVQRQNENLDASRPQRAFVNAAFGDDGFGFDDVVDMINPLQHIPIVSTLYRALTGDKIDVASRLVGGTLYGGFFGLMGAAINAAVEDSTGHDIGENVRLALFGAPDDAEREPVIFAGTKDSSQTADAGESGAQAIAPPDANPKMPDKMPPLTAAQLALLQEHGDGEDMPAPQIAPAAAAAEPPKGPPTLDLSKDQEALLLRSLGLEPPADTTAKAPAEISGPDAPAAPAPAAEDAPEAEITGDAAQTDTIPDGPAADALAPAVSPAPAPGPVHAALRPLSKGATPGPAGFAQQMQTGLERYFAHRMPVNDRPPHPDVIR
jgi:hypothetical protein